MSDVEDDEEFCAECGEDLTDGECTNEDCPNCPDYVDEEPDTGEEEDD
jgi:hypothetical protein